MLLVLDPLDQVYEVAPEALKLAVPPVQMVAEFTCSVGAALTLTFTAALLVPQALETKTV